jgi:citrate lyase subunit beta/citryl-CoA lyase
VLPENLDATVGRPMRTMLYVPGHRSDWVQKAAKYGADAVVIDFEDSVPDGEREAARDALADNAAALREAGQSLIVLRPAQVTRGGLLDIEAATRASVDAVMVPKASVDVIGVVDRTLDEAGSTLGIIPIVESAAAMVSTGEIARRSARNVGIFGGGGAKNGDPQHTLGFDWTVEGLETLYLRSHTVMHARAAGLSHIIGGAWVDLEDFEGLRRHVLSYKTLGYTGYCVIHPNQIPHVHDVFRPSEEELEYARAAIEAMRAAEEAGLGAVRMGADMIDYATVRAAERTLSLADA